jgi:hypothetical protein
VAVAADLLMSADQLAEALDASPRTGGRKATPVLNELSGLGPASP